MWQTYEVNVILVDHDVGFEGPGGPIMTLILSYEKHMGHAKKGQKKRPTKKGSLFT